MTVLQDHVDAIRAGQAPLPLTDPQAVRHALTLRAKGMSYTNIAIVMGIYHGQWYAEGRWSRVCRARGFPAIDRGFGRTHPCP